MRMLLQKSLRDYRASPPNPPYREGAALRAAR